MGGITPREAIVKQSTALEKARYRVSSPDKDLDGLSEDSVDAALAEKARQFDEEDGESTDHYATVDPPSVTLAEVGKTKA